MSTTLLSPATIENEAIIAISKHVALGASLAAEKAARHVINPAAFPMPDDADALEHVFLTRARAMLPAKQELMKANVQKFTTTPGVRFKEFGELAPLALDGKEPMLKRMGAVPASSVLKAQAMVLVAQPQSTVGASSAASPVVEHTKLQFRLHHVRCVDETNGFLGSEKGDDEISLGGSAVDVTGVTRPIAPFHIGDFNDGDIARFNPLRILATFDLKKGGGSFPKTGSVILVLAETDMGGLNGFVKDLVDKVEAEVKKQLAILIGGLAGTAAGGPVGAAIGIAIGIVVTDVFAFLERVWRDDVFPAIPLRMKVPHLAHVFPNGKRHSGDQLKTVSGHGGTYEILYDWLLTD